MFGLICLPYEVLANIVGNIDFDDILPLALSCKALSYLLTEESICKKIVQSKILYSNEALEARNRGGGYASALRRAVKRCESLAAPHPYVVATVGLGDTFLYCKGVLCYTLDDRVRILDLHHSAQDETVVNIPLLLTQSSADIEDTKGVFQILYYSDNIISCMYKTCGEDSTSWLLAFNIAEKRILVTHDLDSTDRIFVRHDERYLYYGTHSELGTDGYKKWVIHGYDFGKQTWFGQKIHLPDMVGSEIGSTVCFEFHDKFFYALSNQTSFEVEEIDWTSFYHCIRFPLESPCKELLEKTENYDMWRRQHQEGPIDDRWTSLKLDSDEATGELRIVESRKEWSLGSSRSQRTYYTTNIIFPDRSKDEAMSFGYEPLPSALISSAASSITVPTSASTSGHTSTSNFNASSSSSTSVPSNSSTSPATTHQTPSARKRDLDLSTLPNDPILKLLRPDDNPHHMSPPPRLPHCTHPGNDGSFKPSITLSKCRIRTYHTPCSTFLDLVDDPLPYDWQGTQRLRLRSGSRKRGPVLTSKANLLRAPSSNLSVALQELYRNRPITMWPAAQDPYTPNEQLDQVYNLLNPKSHLGNVEGAADERSMVYVTGAIGEPRAIVFVGFDPGVKLAGLKFWGEKGVGEGPHVDGRAAGCTNFQSDAMEELVEGKGKGKERVYEDVEEGDRAVVMERKGKGREEYDARHEYGSGAAMIEVRTEAGRDGKKCGMRGAERKSWAWLEPAMYKDIGVGFYFGKEKKKAKGN